MANITRLECIACGSTYPGDRPMQLCPVDHRPVQIRLDLEDLRRGPFPAAERADPEGIRRGAPLIIDRPDLWRYGSLLPLDPRNPVDLGHIVPIGGGWTRLDRMGAEPFVRDATFDLWLKDESRPAEPGGGNPTGSFKDRGMAMVGAMARRFGISRLVVPTQGNAGDSLASYALAAGLEVAIIMPDDTPSPILDRVRAEAERHPSVHLELVKGTIREAGALMRQKYLPDGWFSAATFAEPGWRIEGKKTLGLEIAEQLGGGDAFRLPDVIVYPTGGGTGILGMYKAFEELSSLGFVTGRMPRFICVQSDETAPLALAWEAGETDSIVREPGSTVAVGLNVPGGVGHFRVLEIVRKTAGAALAVSEGRIAEVAASVAGDGIGPEGAACLAALEDLRCRSIIRPGDRVVVVNTCGPEKYDVRYSTSSDSA